MQLGQTHMKSAQTGEKTDEHSNFEKEPENKLALPEGNNLTTQDEEDEQMYTKPEQKSIPGPNVTPNDQNQQINITNKKFSAFTTNEVGHFITSNGFDQKYFEIIVSENINGEALLMLDKMDLKNIGFKLGDAVNVLKLTKKQDEVEGM